METKTTVPNNLKEIRKRLGYTQRQVSMRLGFCSEDRISNWEHGTAIPNMINLFRLSAIYGVPPQELYPELFEHIKKTVG